MIIGLTGQSGAGKSTVAALFAESGFHIIDCDALVHALYGEARYVKAIADAFGEEFIKDGVVDRKKLGALVFSDKNELDFQFEGGMISKIAHLENDYVNKSYIYVFTSVDADKDVSEHKKTVTYNGVTLTSSGAGAVDMHLEDDAIIYIGLVTFSF